MHEFTINHAFLYIECMQIRAKCTNIEMPDYPITVLLLVYYLG